MGRRGCKSCKSKRQRKYYTYTSVLYVYKRVWRLAPSYYMGGHVPGGATPRGTDTHSHTLTTIHGRRRIDFRGGSGDDDYDEASAAAAGFALFRAREIASATATFAYKATLGSKRSRMMCTPRAAYSIGLQKPHTHARAIFYPSLTHTPQKDLSRTHIHSVIIITMVVGTSVLYQQYLRYRNTLLLHTIHKKICFFFSLYVLIFSLTLSVLLFQSKPI